MIKISVIGICLLFLLSATLTSGLIINQETKDDDLELEANSGCNKINEIIDKIDPTLMEDYLQRLVDLGPRMTSTHGSELAAEFLTDELEKMGYDVEYQYWTDFGNIWSFGRYSDKNLIATLNGTNDPEKDILVFNAHYDTVEDSVGAVDDGTGVAAVLGAAYAMSQYSFNRTIKFVLFSGEEVGLLGSSAYAKKAYEANEDIYLQINADMVGVSNTAEDGKTARLSGLPDTQWVLEKVKDISADHDLGFTKFSGWDLDPHYYRGGSDYFGFITHGYKSICFWESGSFDYANTPYDYIKYVNYSYLSRMTKLITATLAYFADAEIEYPQIKITSPKKGKVYFEDRIISNLKGTKSFVFNDVIIYTEVEEGSSPIYKVEFYYDGKLINTDREAPYLLHLNKLSFRKHLIEAFVYDTEGRKSSDFVYIQSYNFLKNH